MIKINNPLLYLSVMFLFAAGCAGAPSKAPGNLLSLDEAIAGAAAAVEAKVEGSTEIALAKFDSPLEELSGFLNDELSGRFSMNGKFTVLARAKRYKAWARNTNSRCRVS
jgi:hypothetical protein